MMRTFNCLLAIVALLSTVIFVGCEPHNENPDKKRPSFVFENPSSTHTSLSVDIIPQDKQSEYIVFLSTVQYFTSNGIDSEQELFEDDHIYFSTLAAEYNMPLKDFLSEAGWLTSGDKIGYSGISLHPDTDYCIYCYGVNFDGEYYTPTTAVYYTVIRTAPSELDIELEVTDITPYEAHLTITPSNDEQYACVFLAANQYPECENDLDTMNAIIQGFMPATFVGEHSEKLAPLMPSTEYIVAAFGFDGKAPTTELFTKRFTSLEQTEGEIAIEDIRVLKIFDIIEVAAIDPRYEPLIEECECLVTVEAITSRPSDRIYYFWFESWMTEEYSDEAFMEDLLMYKPTPSPTVVTLWYSPDEFLFAGIVEDEDGNFSEIYYGEPQPILYEDRSPAEEFFEMGIDIYVPELR